MTITLNLNPAEVRQILLDYVSKQASKHGHPLDQSRQVSVRLGGEERVVTLEELEVELEARIEVR